MKSKIIYKYLKLKFGVRIWALFIIFQIIRNRSSSDKLTQAYFNYFNFLENTADPNTDEGQAQMWTARALREELYAEGENFWNRA